MMRLGVRNMLMPAFIGSAVLVIALSLLTVVARGPWTHSNLGVKLDPRYNRTHPAFVGAPMPFPGAALAVPLASDQVGLGKQLFAAEGCASCHGLDGRGGVVGPSILDTSAKKLRSVTNIGLQGMPAYATGALSDDQLAAIEAFLASTNK